MIELVDIWLKGHALLLYSMNFTRSIQPALPYPVQLSH